MFKIAVLFLFAMLGAETVFPERGFVEKLKKYGYRDGDYFIYVSVKKQKLFLFKGKKLVSEYPVSTAKNGVGSEDGSFKTPLGFHKIAKKIGDGLPFGAVLKGRVFTGVVADIEKEAKSTGKDYVTTRIMWLEGLEEGKNRGKNSEGKSVDSFKRYIYIHGTHEEGLIGSPASHGCIRMKNKDVIELFDKVKKGTIVFIGE